MVIRSRPWHSCPLLARFYRRKATRRARGKHIVFDSAEENSNDYSTGIRPRAPSYDKTTNERPVKDAL